MTLTRRASLLLSLTILVVSPARADEVVLTNGDRLTGTSVSLASGVLTLVTPYGNVRVPWPDVVRVTIGDPMLAALADALRPQPAVIVDGGATAAIVATAGNTDVNNLRLDGDLLARAGLNRYSGAAAIIRAKDRGIETARNWTTAFDYDRFVSTRMFLNANAIFTNDRFRDLDLRTAIGFGVGYEVLTGPRVRLTAEGGAGYVNENLESQPDDSYTALRESVSLDVFALPDRVQFFHVHDGYFGVTGDDNLFVRMQNGVRVTLVAGFVTTLRHDLDYDRSPAVGRSNTDRTLAFTLGTVSEPVRIARGRLARRASRCRGLCRNPGRAVRALRRFRPRQCPPSDFATARADHRSLGGGWSGGPGEPGESG